PGPWKRRTAVGSRSTLSPPRRRPCCAARCVTSRGAEVRAIGDGLGAAVQIPATDRLARGGRLCPLARWFGTRRTRCPNCNRQPPSAVPLHAYLKGSRPVLLRGRAGRDGAANRGCPSSPPRASNLR